MKKCNKQHTNTIDVHWDTCQDEK